MRVKTMGFRATKILCPSTDDHVDTAELAFEDQGFVEHFICRKKRFL